MCPDQSRDVDGRQGVLLAISREGAVLTGTDMHRLGVADEVTQTGSARQRAFEIAAAIATLPPPSVTSTKRAVADLALAHAEALDARTSWMFAQDCISGQARRLDALAAKLTRRAEESR